MKEAAKEEAAAAKIRVVAAAEADAATDTELRRQLIGLREDGIRAKEAVAMVSEAMGLPKNRVYQVWVEFGRKPR